MLHPVVSNFAQVYKEMLTSASKTMRPGMDPGRAAPAEFSL